MTQHRLGSAHRGLPDGDRAANFRVGDDAMQSLAEAGLAELDPEQFAGLLSDALARMRQALEVWESVGHQHDAAMAREERPDYRTVENGRWVPLAA